MSKLLKIFGLCIISLCTQAIFSNEALAYTNEVRQSGSNYIWRINNADQGSTNNLATAINNCIGTGNREVHILAGGNLSAQINLQPGLTLYCHNVTFNKTHGGYGFFRDGGGPIKIYDMVLNNNTSGMGIRTSRASDIYIQNVRIYGGSISIRIDSHPSRPYEDGRWVRNIHIQDCRFENGSSHGLETYGVDGFKGYGLVARNMGECGVLLNKTINGAIGTVDAYRCCYGGGYAGLRYANSCSNVTANMLVARECGRGYFVLTGSNNCHLNNCRITDGTGVGIWLENVVNCSVKAGCTNDGVAVSGSGSYANVSTGGCSGARMAMEEETISIEEESASIHVHPNPATNEITVELPSGYDGEKKANLYDGMGKVATSSTFNSSKHNMYIGNLPEGMYILKIVSNKKLLVTKVIKR